MIWLGMAMAAPTTWSLAAVYDATATARLGVPAGEEFPSSLSWRPYDGMTDSCGPAKSPDGLGVFEAEAIGSGMTPVLTVLLKRRGGQDLRPDDIRISLGEGQPQVLLQPMVEPRHLEITVRGTEGTERVMQLVRTQLETETCMEHKTGRGWMGHETSRVRQAFLLDPPMGTDRSRKFFGGQTDPVPAYLGPPDACLRFEGPELLLRNPGGRGEGSLNLVPTDVWGSSLRKCGAGETAGSRVVDSSASLPLRIGGDEGPYRPPQPTWSNLDVKITLVPGEGSDESRARVTLSLDGEVVLAAAPLFVETETVPGMLDLLAIVPHRYPTVGPPEDPARYTVLMVPDWQVVEALRRLEKDTPTEALHTSNPALADGVSTVLSRPRLLFVQLAPPDGGEVWANLAGVMRSAVRQPWGYTVGSLNGRAPVVLPTLDPPTWDQSLRAQRGDVHAAVLASVLTLFLALWLGLRRLQDLFNPRPEERAHYWPGLETNNIHDNETNSPVADEEEAK